MNTSRAEYLTHDAVMASEISGILVDAPKGIFVDATYGYGSHFTFFSKQHNHLDFIAFDRDLEAVNNSNSSHCVQHNNFSNISSFLKNNNINKISGIFYDFGVSSHQIDSPHRGFSFQFDSDLDMRMDTSQKISAIDVINNYDLNDLIRIFYNFGEESNSKKIADTIFKNRPILTTKELVNIIESSLPKQNPKFTRSTIRRIFQAIRIEVNNELDEISDSLESIKEIIQTNGLMIFLSYHSLEDKIVKQFIDKNIKNCICDPKFAICTCEKLAKFKLGSFKKKKPSKSEIQLNPRSKSAMLRYMVKI